MEHRNEFWEKEYKTMREVVPQNEKERKACEMLAQGCGTEETRTARGLSPHEFTDLLNRLNDEETKRLCVLIPEGGKPATDD